MFNKWIEWSLYTAGWVLLLMILLALRTNFGTAKGYFHTITSTLSSKSKGTAGGSGKSASLESGSVGTRGSI